MKKCCEASKQENQPRQEQIMVINKNILFKDGFWSGMKTDPRFFTEICQLIKIHHTFMPRWGKDGAEENNEFKQIIPYGVVCSKGRICSYRKSKKSSEKRLHGERMIGIGGHIRPEDTTINDRGLLDWFLREWREEVHFENPASFIFPIGIIHDASRPVSQLHLGFAFLIYGEQTAIQVRDFEELTEAKWLTIQEMLKLDVEDRLTGIPGLDNWSKLIVDYLANTDFLGM